MTAKQPLDRARTWLITGCSSGLGRALADLLLRRGERVVATARDPAKLAGLVASHGDRALALRLDVTRPEDISATLDTARGHFGPIDVLVNNAGYGHMGTVEETSESIARELLETNFFGALALIRGVLPEMRQRRSGQIVNVGSVAGRVGFPALGYYCASKFALIGMTEALAAEVAGLNIAVTSIEPGPFATDFTGRSLRYTLPATPDYDLAQLSRRAGTSEWGAGDDPYAGATAILAALDAPSPPRHLILGQPGLDIVERYDIERRKERDVWRSTARLDSAMEH